MKNSTWWADYANRRREERWRKERTRLAIGFTIAILSSAVSGFILGWFSHLEWSLK